jgi:hypothetical protein
MFETDFQTTESLLAGLNVGRNEDTLLLVLMQAIH